MHLCPAHPLGELPLFHETPGLVLRFTCDFYTEISVTFTPVIIPYWYCLSNSSSDFWKSTTCEWFKSYLQGRNQIVSINGVESELTELKHGVPQGSVLGHLLFLIYINDLNTCISNSKVYHFADDTNLLHINSCFKKLQKNINYDLKRLTNWLDSNMISLNCTKTELVYFRKKRSANPNNNKI